mgnify:CR=1 FL=1
MVCATQDLTGCAWSPCQLLANHCRPHLGWWCLWLTSHQLLQTLVLLMVLGERLHLPGAFQCYYCLHPTSQGLLALGVPSLAPPVTWELCDVGL